MDTSTDRKLRNIALAVVLWLVFIVIVLVLGIVRSLPDSFPFVSLGIAIVLGIIWD